MEMRFGNCRVIREIGSGGMATVYKAVQEPLGREVAVKSLKKTIAIDSQFARRFEREAHFMALLRHENVLQVYDFVAGDEGMYIVMEYVEGVDVYSILAAQKQVPPIVAAVMVLQLARALEHAHFRGLIHRDIKPANVMVSSQGQVKLMDFGIARTEMISELTDMGAGLGTPSYMSPEQILGDKIDFRSDIFSLGIVLYQMLTGHKPFVEDESRTVMQKIRLEHYVPARRYRRDTPPNLERILARCLEKLPSNRYATTQALVTDLGQFVDRKTQGNHQAILVRYLARCGLIDRTPAERFLSADASRVSMRERDKHPVLRQVLLGQVGALGLGVVTAGTLELLSVSDKAAAADSLVDGQPLFQESGYLRISAVPWATFYVNGIRLATTPTASAFALKPGRYLLRASHPTLGSTEQSIRIKAKETTMAQVNLTKQGSKKAP